MKDLLDSLRIDDRHRAQEPTRRAGGRRSPRRRYALVALSLLLIGAAAWYGRHRLTASPDTARAATTPVQTAGPPRAGASLTAGGYARAARTVQVVPRVSGRIVTLLVDEGDVVAAGDVIAVLDSRDLEQDVVEASAAVDLQRAELARLEAGTRPQRIAAARADYQAAVARLDLAARELSRSQELASTGAVPVRELEQAETARRVRGSELEAARQALALLEAGPAAEERRAARASLAVAQARWTRATQRLGDARVTAPIGGRVIRKLHEAGDFVSAEVPFIEGADTLAAGSPIVTLAGTGPQEVTVDINETDLARISLGQPVEATPDAFPTLVLPGTVTRLAARADRNKGTLEVRITLEESATVLPEDLSVKLRFLEAGADGRLVTPRR